MTDQQLGSGEWLHAVTITIKEDLSKHAISYDRLEWSGKDLWLHGGNRKRRINEYASKRIPIGDVVLIGY